jgi:hypothetical protein
MHPMEHEQNCGLISILPLATNRVIWSQASFQLPAAEDEPSKFFRAALTGKTRALDEGGANRTKRTGPSLAYFNATWYGKWHGICNCHG